MIRGNFMVFRKSLLKSFLIWTSSDFYILFFFVLLFIIFKDIWMSVYVVVKIVTEKAFPEEFK